MLENSLTHTNRRQTSREIRNHVTGRIIWAFSPIEFSLIYIHYKCVRVRKYSTPWVQTIPWGQPVGEAKILLNPCGGGTLHRYEI
jgi:hypothetical protein